MGVDGGQPVRARAATEATPLRKAGAQECGGKVTLLKAPLSWARSLSKRLSWQTFGSVVVTYHVLKGFLAGGGDEGFIGKPVEFLLGSQHFPAARLQAIICVGATTPWVLRPLIGFLSDTAPIMGYKKKYYLVMMTLLALLATANLGLNTYHLTPWTIVASLFCASLQVAGGTLLVEAKLSEVAKEQADVGPEIVSLKETCMNSGMILSAMVIGPLIHHAGVRAPYFIALPAVGLLFLVPLGNWLRERRLTSEEIESANWRAAVREHPSLFGLGACLLPLLLPLACASTAQLAHHGLAAISAAATAVIVGGFLVLIRPEISGPMVFFFILRCLNLQINGALFYFFTDSPAAFPEGPHFSPLFYVTGMTSVAITGRLLGFMTAKDIFGQWHYRSSLSLTMPLVAVTQLLLVPVLLRWNVRMGIPDSLWILAWTFIDMVVRAWRQFPFAVFALQATTRGLEASSLALTSGVINFGQTLSFFFGGFVLHCFRVGPSGNLAESGVFASLWKVQVVVALLPLAALPLMFLFLPAAKFVDTLIAENPGSAAHGAPAARYCCGV